MMKTKILVVSNNGDGNRIHHWNRSYASHTKNHWRKVAPDSFEFL